MPGVLLAVGSELETAQYDGVDETLVRPLCGGPQHPRESLRRRRRFARETNPEFTEEQTQIAHLLLVRLLVNAEQRGPLAPYQILRRGDVRRDHALFDQSMRIDARDGFHGFDLAV